MADDDQPPSDCGPADGEDGAARLWTPDPRIRLAVRILEDAPFPTPPSSELAERVGLSEFHFSRLFHEQVGKTVGAYARDMCLGQAAFRLKSTDASIHELYADYGYGSQAAFTRAFAARFGAPPAAFRAQARASDQAATLPPALDVRLHRRPSQDGLVRRYVGPPDRRAGAWRAFAAQVAADGLGGGRWFGLMHDDPRVCRPEEFRFDMGFVPARRSLFIGAPETYERYRTTAGFYGTVTYCGRYGSVREGYGALLRGWLQRQSRYTIAGEPLMEGFTSSPPRSDDDVSEVDISIKLSARGHPVNWWEGAEQRASARREWRAVVRERLG